MDLFAQIEDHEQVMFCNDPATGLKAIIAIHHTDILVQRQVVQNVSI